MPSVQKTRLLVYLDPRWAETLKEKKTTKLYPKVKILGKKDDLGKVLDNDFIEIDTTIDETPNLPYSGNRPILVGDIPINPKRFDLCKYGSILAKDKEGKDYILFDEGKLEEEDTGIISFGVIAGEFEKSKEKITILTEKLSVNASDCKSKPVHRDHVIEITWSDNHPMIKTLAKSDKALQAEMMYDYRFFFSRWKV